MAGESAGADGLSAFLYGATTVEEWRPATLAEARARLAPERVLWVNLNAPFTPEMLESLRQDFGVHPLTLEDVVHRGQRPKVEEYEGYLYFVTHMLKAREGERLGTEQVSILVGEGWIVTIQEGQPGDVFGPVRERIRQGRRQVRAGGTDYLLYALLDAIVDAAFPVLEGISAQAAELEDALLDGETEGIQAGLQGLRRDLLTVRRLAWPQRDALSALERGQVGLVRDATRVYLRDVTDHATRVIDFVENSRELLASLMDLHAATVAQRTNEVVRVLTVVSSIFIPLTFVAGVYGMNFEHMPELSSRWGYPAVLLGMATVAVGMLVVFRRRGWF